MLTHINLENTENKSHLINKFFKKEYKVKYNRKLSGKIRLYISERNSIRNISDLVKLYRRDLQ